jgi:hypothetical protein
MKQILLVIFCTGLLAVSSCTKSTDADEYTSIWKPYSQTEWFGFGNAVEGFEPTTGGFTFIANIADTGTYTYTFFPSMYIVSNMTSASDGYVSFRAAIMDGPDTVALSAGGIQLHSFATLSGSFRSVGADSVVTAPTPFLNDVTTRIPLSVNPDSCSRLLLFTVDIAWNPFPGGLTVNPLPKQKKVTVEFFDIEMRINGIDVLSE